MHKMFCIYVMTQWMHKTPSKYLWWDIFLCKVFFPPYGSVHLYTDIITGRKCIYYFFKSV